MSHPSVEGNRNEQLLDEEIHAITIKLPEGLKGSEPVCVSVYQSTSKGGRLVLIDQALDDQNRVAALCPGKGAKHAFLNPSDGVPWKVVSRKVDESMLNDYVHQNHEKVRMDIFSTYQDRFPKIRLDDGGGHVVLGTGYRRCYLCPTSLNQTSGSTRLPRLGMLYTFGNAFGKGAGLLIAARVASDVVLDVRLRTLLRDVGQFGPRGKQGPRSAWEIAADLGEGINISLDESVFLIAKLLLVHHQLYPQHPSAYGLISKLSGDPTQVFAFHGLDAPMLAALEDRKSTSQFLADFYVDIVSIAGACAWNRNTVNTHALQVTEEGKKSISEALPIALTLICGRVTHGYLDKRLKPSAKNKGHFYLLPPAGIPHSPKHLPALAYEDIKSGAREDEVGRRADAFIETLHPSGPAYTKPSWRGFYAVKHQGWVSFKGEWISQRPSKDWFVSYVRARCIKAFQSSDPLEIPDSSTTTKDPLIKRSE